jgi:GDPmannose 4,6-dehydratase
VDPDYYRPTEVDTLLGDPGKAKRKLGWSPRISFNDLIKEMMEEDMHLADKDALTMNYGYKTYNYNE